MNLDFVWQEIVGLSVAAIATMTFIGLIPIGKTKKLKSTWFWKNLGVYVLVGVCVGGSFVPAIKTETPIMFGLITAFFAHLGRKAIPRAVREKIGGLLSAMFGGNNKGDKN